MSNQVNFNYGAMSFASTNFVGKSVQEVLDSAAAQEILNLSGDESVEIRSEGSECYRTVMNDYILQAGDDVRFFRSSGTKG